MNVNAHLLSTYDDCRRRYGIEQVRSLRRTHPTKILNRVLRKAMFSLCNGNDPADVSDHACQAFIFRARNGAMSAPDGTDTYKLAMDHCATIKNIIEYMSRETLLTMHEVPAVNFAANEHTWSFSSWQDDSGVLHRWRFVSSINDDTITKELHSWYTAGDMAMYDAPMSIHLVAVGIVEDSRRISKWTRGWKDPVIPNRMRFQKKSGDPLHNHWRPFFFADNQENSSSNWVDQLEADGAIDGKLKLDINLRQLNERHRQQTAHDIVLITREMLADVGQDPTKLPMRRPSCDSPYTCPHQDFCYSLYTSLDDAGIYDKIDAWKQTDSFTFSSGR